MDLLIRDAVLATDDARKRASWRVRLAVGIAGSPWLKAMLRLCAGAALGVLWGQSSAAWLALVPLLYALWWRSTSRAEACLVPLLYHLVAARGLITGAVRMFDLSWPAALGVVALGAAAASLPFGTLWRPRKEASSSAELARGALLLLITHVPPFCALSLPSPLAAAGVWFPGCGLWGLCALVVTVIGMQRSWRVPVLFSLIVLTHASLRGDPRAVQDVVAVATSFDPSADETHDYMRQSRVARGSIAEAAATEGDVLVLPEGAAGMWTMPMARRWAPFAAHLAQANRVAIVGTTYEGREGLHAGAVVLGSAAQVYRQRVPMPIAMWRPWQTGRSAFVSNFMGSGVVRLGAERVAGVFVCWELAAPWAVARSALEGANVFVGLSNMSWLRGTNASAVQQQLLSSWSLLFAVPAVLAKND